MKKNRIRRAMAAALSVCAALLFLGVPAEAEVHGIVEELVVDYAAYGEESADRLEELLGQLRAEDAALADKWASVLELWRTVSGEMAINYDVLPGRLPDTDELCIVTLGFQLDPDGSIREELKQRLQVALRSAEKYPNAFVLVTGGGTATQNPSATEAGRMAEWLIAQGIDPSRVIVEDQSITTAQNAIFSYGILRERYPQVSQLAIVSSDYHIATGTLLFGAEATLQAEAAGDEALRVVSNAAWHAPTGTLSAMFQAGALIELSGDAETAFEIYYETYDIHELTPLK